MTVGYQHGILGLAAILEDVGTASENAGAVFFVKVAELRARTAGRQAPFAWDDLKCGGLAAGHHGQRVEGCAVGNAQTDSLP